MLRHRGDMELLLDITWSPGGEHLQGTLRPLTKGEPVPFSGTLELVTRVEELLVDEASRALNEGDGNAKGESDATT